MPRVFIPSALRSLTAGVEVIEVAGSNVKQVVQELDRQFPGTRDRLCQDDSLRAGISVVVGGSVSSLGLLQSTAPDSEVHFLPAIGGG